MTKTNKAGHFAVKSNGLPVVRNQKKHVFVHHSKHEIVTSPMGVKTWTEATDKIMRNYSEAWARLAKR